MNERIGIIGSGTIACGLAATAAHHGPVLLLARSETSADRARATVEKTLSRLEAEPLREVTTWLARYQRFWVESHERLDDLLSALQAGQEQDPRPDPAATAKGNDDEQD